MSAAISSPDDPQTTRRKFGYDIAGLLRIDSEVELRELRHFASDASDPAEVIVRLASDGRVRKLSHHASALTAGDWSSDLPKMIHIGTGEPIEVEMAPQLTQARHGRYGEVIVALLRLLLVSKGYVLLHATALVADGSVVLLSTRPSEGTTGFRLMRDLTYEDVTDDITILPQDGSAICYPRPRPLHLASPDPVRANPVSTPRLSLSIRSQSEATARHSATGIMAKLLQVAHVDTVVQIMVPPASAKPRAMSDGTILPPGSIEHVYLLDRGQTAKSEVPFHEGVRTLIENTDSIYGFPRPLRIGADGYAELRDREERLLRAALDGAHMSRVIVPGQGWADIFPRAVPTPVAQSDDLRVTMTRSMMLIRLQAAIHARLQALQATRGAAIQGAGAGADRRPSAIAPQWPSRVQDALLSGVRPSGRIVRSYGPSTVILTHAQRVLAPCLRLAKLRLAPMLAACAMIVVLLPILVASNISEPVAISSGVQAALGVAPHHASGNAVRFSETFDKQILGSALAGWAVHGGTAEETAVVALPSVADRSLRLHVARAGRALTFCKMGTVGPSMEVRIDFMFQGHGASDRVAVSLPSATKELAEASASLGRGFAIQAGSAGFTLKQTLESGIWYRSVLSVDADGLTISWRVDDREGDRNILVAPAIPLATGIGAADGICFSVRSARLKDQFYFDNLRLVTP